MSSQTPYIGSKISLISKLDIRYEGTLHSVNTADSTISLIKVRSLGTEDRVTSNPVAARNDIYEHIIFKASDIKDLIVSETPKVQTMGGLPHDPAIVSVSNKPDATSPQPGASAPKIPPLSAARPVTGQYNAPASQPANRSYHNGPVQQLPSRGRSSIFSFSSGMMPPRATRHYDNDFDFETANEQFQQTLSDLVKEKLQLADQEVSVEIENAPEEVKEEEEGETFYNKTSSFFDSISCESLQWNNRSRPDWRKERETNQETFGPHAVRSMSYRRGFGGFNRGMRRGNGYNSQGGGHYNGGWNQRRGSMGGYNGGGMGGHSGGGGMGGFNGRAMGGYNGEGMGGFSGGGLASRT